MTVLAVTVIVSIVWIRILKRFDESSAIKRSGNSIRGFFFAGILSIPVLFVMYAVIGPIFDPIEYAFPLLYQILYVGLFEETSKFLIFYLAAVQSHSIKEPKDGILHAASVGLCFAVLENILYSVYGMDVLLLRSILTVVGHMTYAAVWGYVAGVIIYTRRAGDYSYSGSFMAAAVAFAAVFHGFYNHFLSMSLPVLALLTDAVILALALWSISYLKKKSPYAHFRIEEFRKAIPQLKMALASNPDNFALHKRIGLFYIRAGKYAPAQSHLCKAARLRAGELSSRFYRSLLDIVSNNIDREERGLEKFRTTTDKLSIANLRKLRREVDRVFAGHPRRKELYSLIDEAVEAKKSTDRVNTALRRMDGGGPRAGKARPRPADSWKHSGTSYSTQLSSGKPAASGSSSGDHTAEADLQLREKKRRASGRIIEAKRRELEAR